MRVTQTIVLAAVVATAGCSRAPVVTITNQSTVTLSNVVVSCAVFLERVDSIPAGGEHSLIIHPKGESGLRVTFEAGTRQIDSGEQSHFEAVGGYRVGATVHTNLSISLSSELP